MASRAPDFRRVAHRLPAVAALVLGACGAVRSADSLDTVRVAGGGIFLVSRSEIVSLSGDSARARLPWSSPSGVVPTAWCEGPDRGLVVIEAARGGRIVHLNADLRAVSVHPLPEGLRASDLAGARASWDPVRGLTIETARPPLRWNPGFLSGPMPPPEPVTPSAAP